MQKIKNNYAVQKYEIPEGHSLFLDDEEQLCSSDEMKFQGSTVYYRMIKNNK